MTTTRTIPQMLLSIATACETGQDPAPAIDELLIHITLEGTPRPEDLVIVLRTAMVYRPLWEALDIYAHSPEG